MLGTVPGASITKIALKQSHHHEQEAEKVISSDEENVPKNKKTFTKSIKFKLFKSDWKANYLVQEVTNDEYKFQCLSCV